VLTGLLSNRLVSALSIHIETKKPDEKIKTQKQCFSIITLFWLKAKKAKKYLIVIKMKSEKLKI